MKWYHSVLFACGIAFFSPQIASAKPIPAAADNHGIAGAKPAPVPAAKPAPAAKPGAPVPAARPAPAPAPAARPAPLPPPNMAAKPPAPPRPGMAPAPKPAPAPVMGMNSREFRRLIDSIDRERRASKKLKTARKALDGRLTSAQVKDILVHLSSERDRVDFACDAYHSVVDRKNWSSILSVFSSAHSRNRVMACAR